MSRLKSIARKTFTANNFRLLYIGLVVTFLGVLYGVPAVILGGFAVLAGNLVGYNQGYRGGESVGYARARADVAQERLEETLRSAERTLAESQQRRAEWEARGLL